MNTQPLPHQGSHTQATRTNGGSSIPQSRLNRKQGLVGNKQFMTTEPSNWKHLSSPPHSPSSPAQPGS